MSSRTLAGFGQNQANLPDEAALPALADQDLSAQPWQLPEVLDSLTPSEKALGLLSKVALLPLGINWVSATASLVGNGVVEKASAYITEKPHSFANLLPLLGYWSASTLVLAGATALTISDEYYKRKERRKLTRSDVSPEITLDRVSLLDIDLIPRSVLMEGSRTRKFVEYVGFGAMCSLLVWAIPDFFASLYNFGQYKAADYLGFAHKGATYSESFARNSDLMINKVRYAVLAGLGSLTARYLPGPQKTRTDFIASQFPKALAMTHNERN